MSGWLVTGASTGIGRAVTEQLIAAGHRVAALARRPEQLPSHERLWTAAVDVTDTARLRDVVEQAFTELGRIDVVFSNAGAGAFGAAEELSDEQIAAQIALNTTAPIQLFRAVVPHLRAQGGGRFVQNSTMGGQVSSAGGSLYHASKWGIEGFLESVVDEVAPFGIGVTIVEPGNVRTAFGANLTIADASPHYAQTPVGQVRRFIEAAGNLTGDAPGDPARIAAAVIDSAARNPAPRRLALGRDAHAAITAALTRRLDEVEAGRDVAFSTDFPSTATTETSRSTR